MTPGVVSGIGLFVAALTLGWWGRRRGWLDEVRASRLVRWIVIGPSPVVLCLSFWAMDLRTPGPWLLPLLGLAISASTLIPAYLYARRTRLPDPQTGSFLTCAFFSNLGYLGAFTAFALHGEVAYGLCVLYFVFFTPSFYTWGFWAGARYGQEAQVTGEPVGRRLRLVPFVGMALGAVLSMLRVPRPELLGWLNHVLIPVDTGVYLMAIGSQLTFASPRPWLGASLAMCGIKFLYTPAVAWCLASLAGLQGLPRWVVLLEASMPVAVSPLALPMLFGLDRRLSNALWVFTTAVSVPWLLTVIPFLERL